MTAASGYGRGVLVTVAVAAIALGLLTNLPWQLDDYDQAKQAFTSFEMVKEGHWLYQRTPHERVATKPPLVGWISAGLYEVSRSWDLAWRLPGFAAAVALALLLWRAGNSYGAAGGLVAVSAFSFNLLTPRLASLVRTDMPLALVVCAIGLQIWQHARDEQPWQTPDQWVMFGLLTAGMLIKGPIIYAFLLPGIVTSALIDGRYREFGWPGWWPWIVSLGIFGLWVFGGCVAVPGFYDQVVVREFLGRFGETMHRPQPFYFYLPHLLHKFAPWSVLFIALSLSPLYRRFKLDRFNRSGSPEAAPTISTATWWLVAWSLGGLIVMSIIPSKRVDRTFPIIPPLCLLVAVQFEQRGWLKHNRVIAGVVALSMLYAGGYAGFKIYTGYRDHRDALVQFGRFVREQAAPHHWRYEIAEASDEGLLLYCDKLHFVAPDDAAARWNAGSLDALVVEDEAAWLKELQPPAAQSLTIPKSERRQGARNYAMLIR